MRLGFMALTVLAAGLLGAMASNANAEFMDGEELHKACQELRRNERTFSAPMCMGFVEGVVSTIKAEEFGICFPDPIIAGTITDIVTNYLEREPQERQYAGVIIVIKSLKRAYPCK